MANSGNNTKSPDSKAGTKPSGNTARKTTKKKKKTTVSHIVRPEKMSMET